MRITQVFWFTERGKYAPIGIVIGVGAAEERKAYIGTCSGIDEPTDKKRISENGAKLTVRMLEDILKELGGE